MFEDSTYVGFDDVRTGTVITSAGLLLALGVPDWLNFLIWTSDTLVTVTALWAATQKVSCSGVITNILMYIGIQARIFHGNDRFRLRVDSVLANDGTEKWLLMAIWTESVVKIVKNILDGDKCTFCHDQPESIIHLFWHCNTVQYLWDTLANWVAEKKLG